MNLYELALSKAKTDKMKPFEYGMIYTEPMKDAWVGGYMNNPDNYNKNFVQRTRESNPNTAISRQIGDNPNHRESLRMANSGNQVFPTIQYKNGQLENLQRTEAPQEVIYTSTPEQAEVLAWNEYKRGAKDNFNYGDKPPSLTELFEYYSKQ